MRLEAGHAARADDGVVGETGGQLQPVAGLEVDRSVWQPEADRAGGHDDDLVVAVVVRAVPIARPVGPGPGSRPSAISRARRALVSDMAEAWYPGRAAVVPKGPCLA